MCSPVRKICELNSRRCGINVIDNLWLWWKQFQLLFEIAIDLSAEKNVLWFESPTHNHIQIPEFFFAFRFDRLCNCLVTFVSIPNRFVFDLVGFFNYEQLTIKNGVTKTRGPHLPLKIHRRLADFIFVRWLECFLYQFKCNCYCCLLLNILYVEQMT